ncbi:homocysteine S-methyltransferase family protein [bacterium]|nr:homocysteine S-methyltransferase family protein [bacterium]
MHSLIQQLCAAGPVVTDGAWGTELQARGLAVGQCPDAWNLTHADKVEEVARAYVDAGSQVILTNTFGANRVRLAEFGLADQAADINRAGAAISKGAAGDHAVVFASIGPSGKMLMMEEVTEDELQAAYLEQCRALLAGGADGLVVETMADLAEAKLAVAAAKTTGLPVVACLVFDAGAARDRTMMGTTPEDEAAAFTAAGADVIGANCGNGIEGYVPICRRLHQAAKTPVWIKANAGLPEMVDGRAVYRTGPAVYAGYGPALVTAGAAFIGGCCGTTPEHIRALVRTLRPAA